MFWSNVQSVRIEKGDKPVVSNNRMEHPTRREAYLRVLRAISVNTKIVRSSKGNPKEAIYYADRQYTVVLP